MRAIDQMVHRDVGSSSISIPLIEVFCFDNGNAFLFPFFTPPFFFFSFVPGFSLYLPGVSSFSASLSASSSFSDFFLCVPFPPPFYQTLFFSPLQSLCFCLFVLSTSDSSLPLLRSCFLPTPLTSFPLCCSLKDSRYDALFQFAFIQEEGQSGLDSQQQTIGNK